MCPKQNTDIYLDYSLMMEDVVGENGLSKEMLSQPRFLQAAEAIHSQREEMGFRKLPFISEEEISNIERIAADVRDRFESFVVFGIGGSALGPAAVHLALNHIHYNELPKEKRNGPRFFVEDNVDPERMQALLDLIDPATTCFNVITKSGSTSETMAQFLIAANWLKERGIPLKNNIIATTDHVNGNLIKIAQQEELTTLYIPADVGGRFSELTPVGLLSAAVCGIDIRALLKGAARMDELCSCENLLENIAFVDGALQILAEEKGMNVSVMMPYSDHLRLTADWYAQLWAESLGKRYNRQGGDAFTGQTPVKALGVTDQHSQVQLYTEGPFDKVITFIAIENYGTTFNIPHGYPEIPDVSFLGGHSLDELIMAEQYATAYALKRAGRLSKKIVMPEINAYTMGQLLYMLEMETAFVGEVYNINAFDQPGVEEGKNGTYALLGKRGFEAKRAEMDGAQIVRAEYTL